MLDSYERDNDLIIIDPSEWEDLRSLCAKHGDLELGPKELFGFLR